MRCPEAGKDGEKWIHHQPGISFIEVNPLVSKETDNKGSNGEDQNADCEGKFGIG